MQARDPGRCSQGPDGLRGQVEQPQQSSAPGKGHVSSFSCPKTVSFHSRIQMPNKIRKVVKWLTIFFKCSEKKNMNVVDNSTPVLEIQVFLLSKDHAGGSFCTCLGDNSRKFKCYHHGCKLTRLFFSMTLRSSHNHTPEARSERRGGRPGADPRPGSSLAWSCSPALSSRSLTHPPPNEDLGRSSGH